MPYRIPIGTPIIPFVRSSRCRGRAALTTVVVEFADSEILERLLLDDNGATIEYVCLSLGSNPTDYDSCLVRTTHMETLSD